MADELVKIEADEVLSGTMKAKRAKLGMSQQDVEIFHLDACGVPHSEIADEYQISIPAVKASVRNVDKQIKAGLVIDVVAFKSLQHLKLDGLAQAAMKGYRKTTGTERVVRRKTHKDGTVEETITEREAAGDPRYLNTTMKAWEAQRGLWAGVDAPKGIAHTNFDGTDNPQVTLDILMQMPVEKLEVLDQAREVIETTLSHPQTDPDGQC